VNSQRKLRYSAGYIEITTFFSMTDPE